MADPVVTLAGDPPTWPATVRDLVRSATDGGLDRAAALEELGGDQPPDDGTAERRLAFLATAGILACEDDRCRPGESGQEYLRTHDESVLFGALADAFVGFEALVEALAVRPITDVEAADLLSAERDGDVDTAGADRYLAWLAALGYSTRADGVNDLTRTGRRLVATTDRLTAPGEDATPPAGGHPDADASTPPSPGDGMRSDATGADGQRSTADTPATEAATPPNAEPTSRPDATPPTRPPSSTDDDPVDADADLEGELRARYDDTCMLCGDRRQAGPESGYADIHFLMPRQSPHDGPAVAENALVVCPNHRADLEHGTVTVDPQSLTVEHDYESAVDGRTVRTVADHDVGAQYLAYHNDVVVD